MQKVLQRLQSGAKGFLGYVVASFKLVFTNLGLIFFAFMIGLQYQQHKSLKEEVDFMHRILGATQQTAMRADQLSSYCFQQVNSIEKRLEMIKFGQTVEIKILDLNK